MKIAALVLGFALSTSTAFAESYGGIGLTIQEAKKKVQIVEVRPNGPAHRAGVLAGEFIVGVDGLVTEGLKSSEVADLVRGTPGTVVTLSLLDSTEHATRDVRVTRETINIPCLIEGTYSINFYGNLSSGQLSGNVGGKSIFWNVVNGSVYSSINGKNVSLQLSASGNSLQLTGYINGTYVSWYGSNGWFYGSQRCIPN